MNENEIRKAIAEVKDGTLSRRSFIRTLAAVGSRRPLQTRS